MKKRRILSKLLFYADGSFAWNKLSALEAYLMVVILFFDYWYYGRVNEVVLNWSLKIIPVLALLRPVQKLIDKKEKKQMNEFSGRNIIYRMFYHHDGTFSMTKLGSFTGNVMAMLLFFDYRFKDLADEIVLEWSAAIIPVLAGLSPFQEGFTGLVKSGLSAITRRRITDILPDDKTDDDGKDGPMLNFTDPQPRAHYGKAAQPSQPNVQPKTKAEQFIFKFWDIAKRYQEQTGLSAIFTLAQGGIERGWNIKSTGYNLFGITAPENYRGKKILLRTTEQHDTNNRKYPVIHSVTWDAEKKKYIYDCERYFKVYNSYEECFADRLKVLQLPHFKHAWAYRTDPYMYVRALQSGEKIYATGTDYVAAMGGFIKQTERIVKKLGLA
jgi:hypothetical protein